MSDLVELVEGPSPPPPGRALDIGCGTGTDSIYLAQHGWAVTGVDMVPRGLAIAHRRADEAGVSLRFVEGDVTRLSDFGVGEGYTLLVDFGCFHTIPPDRRDAYVESVSKVAAPGSTFLLSALPARPASRRWRRASQPRRSGSASMATDGTSSAPNQFLQTPSRWQAIESTNGSNSGATSCDAFLPDLLLELGAVPRKGLSGCPRSQPSPPRLPRALTRTPARFRPMGFLDTQMFARHSIPQLRFAGGGCQV
jgi:SAM-dependent methyltransferase